MDAWPSLFSGCVKYTGKSLLAHGTSLWEDSGFIAWGVDQLEGECVLPGFLNRPAALSLSS